jgi:methylated-DNA-[protein]-cysteine S-methyltransferase
MSRVYASIETPVGLLDLVASAEALHALGWRGAGTAPDLPESPEHPVLRRAIRQLAEYFAGRRREFDLPLMPQGTEFQRRAWEELRRIPYGQTISYGEQARRMGQPGAMRAVGLANGRNPIAIIIPCHRVIAAGGKLGGFGGGLENKRLLLALEAEIPPRDALQLTLLDSAQQ